MQAYGLIGYPLAHSFSPAYFREKFAREGIRAEYTAYPLEDIRRFPGLIAANPELRGLNVTIPHKIAVAGYMDQLDPAALAAGAVNCIRIRDGVLTGYNTDVTGFRKSLEPLLGPADNKALVLGSGGAALAVNCVLDQLEITRITVSRSPQGSNEAGYHELSAELVASVQLIINTTPLGMHPDTETAPAIPYEAIGSSHLLYDLVYNPSETVFLARGARRGARIKNGLEMLHIQAEEAWEIWQH